MTAVDAALLHSHFDLPRRRRPRATTIAIAASVAVHLTLGAYVYQAKFSQVQMVNTGDPPPIVVEIPKVPPKTPPAPPKTQQPVPRIQVHETPFVPDPTVDPLPMD